MNKRTIMIFPEFQNMEIINNIRRQYDPLYELVQPHITLVFPFESPISNEELANVLNLRLQEIPPFELKLNGISMHADTSGNYPFLNVIQGTNELKIIHQALYDN